MPSLRSRLAGWGIALVAPVATGTFGDVSALVQVNAGLRSQEQAMVDAADIMRPKFESASVNCNSHPALCRAPFNCVETKPDAAVQLNQQVANTKPRSLGAMVKSSMASTRTLYATSDGHANMSWYCGTHEQYAMMECAAGNLSGYADLKKLEKPVGVGGTLHRIIHHLHHDMLAQYCFNMGHCNDQEVAQGMTIKEGEMMCDREFGHRAWATFTEQEMEMSRLLSGAAGTLQVNYFTSDGLANVKLGRPSSKVIGKMSCAEGHYHCDVYSCKANYCNDKTYWKKYHNRLPKKL